MLSNKSMRLGIAALMAACASFAVQPEAQAGDYEEGGYVAPDGLDAVWGFVKHFSRDQYYYSYDYMFRSSSNYYVDDMDFAYYCGHGAPYLISQYGGTTNLSSAGNTSHRGYGDADLEFIAFHSCKVVPSPLERSDWWSGWVNTNGIFDGLHQVLGFRTDASIGRAPAISSRFGSAMKNGGAVWQSWFDAIDREGYSWEYGCAVMHPTCQNDSYRSWARDPHRDHQDLTVWWQY